MLCEDRHQALWSKMSRPKRRRGMAPDDASDTCDSSSCSGEVENVSSLSETGWFIFLF